MPKFKVKDIQLAAAGKNKIALAEKEMPVLKIISEDFKKRQPFKDLTIAACLHVTKETAVLVKALVAGGARVAICGSNPLSTQDDVAAALASMGVNVFAWRGVNEEKYYWCFAIITGGTGDDKNKLPINLKDQVVDVLGMVDLEDAAGVRAARKMGKDRLNSEAEIYFKFYIAVKNYFNPAFSASANLEYPTSHFRLCPWVQSSPES